MKTLSIDNIKHPIKLVIWDLDDTLWKGTLAEKDNIKLFDERIKLIKYLNSRGIINSICSKNDYKTAKQKLEELGIWDLFVFANITFSPKGQIIADTIKNIQLKAENVLFIDDNELNLNEVVYYSPNINTMSADNCMGIYHHEYLRGKDDSNLTRYKQYKQLEAKFNEQKNHSDNLDFLKSLGITVELINYKEDLLDRIYELCDRTNQLNFTKTRMTKSELKKLGNNKKNKFCCVSVRDKFGDNGIAGFFVLQNNNLIHYVFSCRILGLNIEQWLYAKLNFPDIKIKGEVASKIGKEVPVPDYIAFDVNKPNNNLDKYTISHYINTNNIIDIYGLGACDLYYAIALLRLTNVNLIYECNEFRGKYHGVNVGLEDIRSSVEMNAEEKEYCRINFWNYTGRLAFNTKMFEKDYDYAIFSFLDDMTRDLYQHKENPNIRVYCNVSDIIYKSGCINRDKEKNENWLRETFKKIGLISPDRFFDNLKWIRNKLPQETIMLLITFPDREFFINEKMRSEKIIKHARELNQKIFEFAQTYAKNTRVIDMNDFVLDSNNLTNSPNHFTSETSFKLGIKLLDLIASTKSNKNNVLSNLPVKNRKIAIYGDDYEALSAYYCCAIGGLTPACFLYDKANIKINGFKTENIDNIKESHYIVVAKNDKSNLIYDMLQEKGYKPIEDFIIYSAKTNFSCRENNS